MKITKKKWFAWYPVKMADGGWIWLKFVWREIRTETKPIVRCIIDPDYLHEVVENIKNEQNPN